jgi:hypothetical protein
VYGEATYRAGRLAFLTERFHVHMEPLLEPICGERPRRWAPRLATDKWSYHGLVPSPGLRPAMIVIMGTEETFPMMYRVYDIDFDTDGEEIDDLPTEMQVEYDGDEPAMELADVISDKTGWCVNSFQFEAVEPTPTAPGI